MRSALALLALISVGAFGCQVNAEVKTGGTAKGSENDSFSANEPSSSAPASSPTASATQADIAPTPPPPEACPMSCYVASGADHVAVSDQESASIRTALEPVVAGMRACTSPEQWRRRGSPVLHLRVAADGLVSEIDVDPHHGYEYERNCLDSAARTAVSLSLPGRHAVRCAERCVVRGTTKTKKRR